MQARLALVAWILAAPAWAQQDPRGSIVKVYVTSQQANYATPWEMTSQQNSYGSGCIIAGRRILTNAHVVSDQTFLRVRRAGQAEKHIAKVVAVSHELDLALLTVDDDAFFKDARPLEIGELPIVGQSVVALGFPKGGTRLTVTEGVVSRVERRRYAHSQFYNLACQIDAAINPGASGGPVLRGTRIAGVAFQAGSGQSIGYMVPAPVVRHFLDDLKDGRHDGAPILPVHWQDLENAQLRAHYKVPKERSGVLVRRIGPSFEGPGKLQAFDVLLSVDGRPVANDGTIPFRSDDRIDFRHAIDRRQVGDKIKLAILRGGKEVTLEVALGIAKANYPFLVPRVRYERRASYYIAGGLVFAPLTANYYNAWDKWHDVPIKLQHYWYEMRTAKNAARKEVVVLIDVLPDRINVGYPRFEDSVLSEVNGRPVRSLKDLVAMIEKGTDDSFSFLFEGNDGEAVFSAAALKERGPKILENYRVPHDRSADLR